MEVHRIMTHILELLRALLEELVGIVFVEGHARAEAIDQRKTLVLHASFDELDQVFDLAGITARNVGSARGDS